MSDNLTIRINLQHSYWQIITMTPYLRCAAQELGLGRTLEEVKRGFVDHAKRQVSGGLVKYW